MDENNLNPIRRRALDVVEDILKEANRTNPMSPLWPIPA
jgi:hypothetical protein